MTVSVLSPTISLRRGITEMAVPVGVRLPGLCSTA